MVPATSCIAGVPWSAASTPRARYSANSTAAIPAMGMISWMTSAISTGGRSSSKSW
jgi:hypothetical protein